ncbi:MAG: DNA-3-methyladenine glycosylase [Pseudomonadales bacterium]|nr:DNA-3-methyladenine glycosylase [Pseudomonadales bacterium]MBO6704262.1 DNA-3-methyladenine glycosylase [Pseudomonadales bacterium]MBO7007521.1 DNA-3-methyladenine glycosylase [Pseudomonadales bacterium]
MMVSPDFFDLEPLDLAQRLIGKVLRHRIHHPLHGDIWLSARIIETEAYYLSERGSHSSLGYTEKRRAMFMDPGTIYMYYARGGDSLNFSAQGEGNGVLIKSGSVHIDKKSPRSNVAVMQAMNPINGRAREESRLCSGQTLLCRSLGLKVPDWNQRTLKRGKLVLEDVGIVPSQLIQSKRLGIPSGRDDHLPYRFIDFDFAHLATKNPLKDDHKIIHKTPRPLKG